jgi:hypothetical protein
MIKKVTLGKELVVSTENKVGVLANISKIMADHDINIEGVAGYGDAKEAKIMLVTDDNLRAGDALRKAGFKAVKESEVIILDLINKPGALKGVTSILAAAQIDLRYVYGTICTEGCPARMILATNANEKAFVLLKTT